MKDFSMDHQRREERVSDLSLFAILSLSSCLPCLIIESLCH